MISTVHMIFIICFYFQAMDNQTEEGEENEEEIEYIVEKLDTDEEESMELQDKGDEEEVVGEEEEEAKEIDNDLCAQLESDDETSKPVIKKIKLEAQVYIFNIITNFNKILVKILPYVSSFILCLYYII